MPPPQGLAHFPGVQQIESCTASLSHGVTPSVFRLSIAPQASLIADGGPLVLTFGRYRIILADCKVDSASVVRNRGGLIVSLSILDRRWKWNDGTGTGQMGQISGRYNLRGPDGKILRPTPGSRNALDDSERTPQQLAALCLTALGETRFDVSAMPNSPRPKIEWEIEPPALALANLVEEMGCRVVLGLDNRITIRRNGFGVPLPNGPIVEQSGEIDPPEQPDSIEIVAAPTRYQVDFELEPVGIDTDYTIKPIAELTYRPDQAAADGGWPKIDIEFFEEIADADARELARQSVFRWYRIKASVAHPHLIPGYGSITNLEQILPIEPEQVESVVQGGVRKNRPAIVFGSWYTGKAGLENTADAAQPIANVKSDTVVNRPWSLDQELGIVQFGEPIFRVAGAFPNLTREPAKLRLRTACNVREPATGVFLRYHRGRQNRGRRFGTPPKFVRRDELVLTITPTYLANYAGVASMATNQSEIDQEIEKLLDVEAFHYQTRTPETTKYAGLLPINLDGALQSITWEISKDGAFTTVSRNNDQSKALAIGHDEKRSIERAKDTAWAVRSIRRIGIVAERQAKKKK